MITVAVQSPTNYFFIYSAFEYAEEMDWDRNGQVSFREFLFALIKWVGMGNDDEIPVTETSIE